VDRFDHGKNHEPNPKYFVSISDSKNLFETKHRKHMIKKKKGILIGITTYGPYALNY